MDGKRFTKNDSGFVCANCGKEVPPLRYTSRNHCPSCLCSLHLDVNPGDRAADCGGVMDAVFAEPDAKRGFILTHRCRVCGAVRRNKAAADDDREKLIRLTAAHG
ncbi:MAG: RNHCP domain-containing protein [Clostridia bacterium]|nr:RNHCP domain-containing protein [Clostridia bacterium]